MKKLLKKYGRRRIGQMGGKRKGFTLIELLIVLTILAILVAVVAISLTTFVGKGTKEACRHDQRALQTAAVAFYSQGQNWPTTVQPTTDNPQAINWTTKADSSGDFLVPTYIVETPDSQAECGWGIDVDGVVGRMAADGSCPCEDDVRDLSP